MRGQIVPQKFVPQFFYWVDNDQMDIVHIGIWVKKGKISFGITFLNAHVLLDY